jgi:hypothetical protein
MKRLLIATFVILHLAFGIPLSAAVPNLINYQGRVAVGAVNFDGSGQFKFALVNAAGTTTYWSNDGTSTAGSEPTAAVTRPVTKGLYSVQLGDTGLTNMIAVPASVFDNADVRLRVWFNDGTNGFQLLTPDQRLTSVGFAMKAASADTAVTVPDGAITAAKLATGAVGSTQLGSGLTLGGTTSGTFSGSGAALTTLSGSSITTGTLGDARLSSNVALLNRTTQNFTGTTNTFSGNVGIGATTAASKLVVAGNTTASTQQLVLQGATDPNKQLLMAYNTTGNYGWIQPIVQGTGFTNLNLNPNGGKVGIGALADANNSALSVTSSAAFQLDLGGVGGTTSGKMMRLGYNQTGDYAEIMSVHSGVNFKNLVMLKDGGNVGVGVTNPLQKLHVAGQGIFAASTAVYDPGGAVGPALHVGFSSTGDYGYINAVNTGVFARNLALQPGDGNVGIGKTDPAYKLDVNGVANVTAVRFPDGTVLRSAAGIGDPNIGTVTYTAAGTYSWVAPANATSVHVDLIGGGGGGGGGGAADDANSVTHTIATAPSYTGTCKMGGTGGGGGGGGNKQHFVYLVTPGTSYTIVVGAGGAGGALAQAGGAGGVTSFSLAATTIATAPGGSGGASGATLPNSIPYEGPPITGGAGGAGGVSGTIGQDGISVTGGAGATGISGAFSDMARDGTFAQALQASSARQYFCGPWATQRDASAAGGTTTGVNSLPASVGGAGGQGATRQSRPLAGAVNNYDDPGTAGSAGTAGSVKLVIY